MSNTTQAPREWWIRIGVTALPSIMEKEPTDKIMRKGECVHVTEYAAFEALRDSYDGQREISRQRAVQLDKLESRLAESEAARENKELEVKKFFHLYLEAEDKFDAMIAELKLFEKEIMRVGVPTFALYVQNQIEKWDQLKRVLNDDRT